jgi:alanine racemase
MSLRLSVDNDAWQSHVTATARLLGDLLPVVKGNGYGFGRANLMPRVVSLAPDVAVGSVHELVDVPTTLRPFVLTPIGSGVLADPTSLTLLRNRNDAVVAVGSKRDLDVLKSIDMKHSVIIKVESSMHRYGVPASFANELRKLAERAGHRVVAWSAHLPLSGNDEDRMAEARRIADSLATDIPLHVSHIGGAAVRLRSEVNHQVVVRAGTQLWLGDKSMISLHADVIAVRTTASNTAGYRATVVPTGARLVMVGCGSSHGITALDDGLSPFHFAKRRLDMLEAPHMHTTMLTVTEEPCPNEGDWVDVQQPMTRVLPDIIAWN